MSMSFPTNDQLERLLPSDARRILEDPEQLILLSLDPETMAKDPETGDFIYDCSGGKFYGCRVVGQMNIDGQERRGELIKALYNGITADRIRVRMCFEPHHGIRAVRGQNVLDLVICFMCSRIHMHSGAGNQQYTSGMIADTPAAVFNRILTAAGIPLGYRSEKGAS
jgi:hypothetical protein